MDGLRLSVDVGQTIALVGPSGSGKSTVIDLIQRFHQVSSGQVSPIHPLPCLMGHVL